MFIHLGSVSKVDIEEARDHHKQNEEGEAEDRDLIFVFEQELGQGNGYVVASRAVRVSILLEVFVGSLIS